jgi:hypothetical protein
MKFPWIAKLKSGWGVVVPELVYFSLPKILDQTSRLKLFSV